MKITIVGIGYVGLSLATLLSQDNDVYLFDIDGSRVDMVNKHHSPIVDHDIECWFESKNLKLAATTDCNLAYQNADFIIIATPTDYDLKTNVFNTTTVESVCFDAVRMAPNATIIIKSTVPIGFTQSLIEKSKFKSILFSPEFLREGKALNDNLYPSRIVVGYKGYSLEAKAQQFAKLLKDHAISRDVPILLTGLAEAESIKLFANTYLALRIAFFNELDSFCQIKDLDSKQIIDGVCLDSRIGLYYNNPSFGYGGYCLPKDTKQLLANFDGVPSDIIRAVVQSNSTRKQFIASEIMKGDYNIVGIYRLNMKSGSDNYRNSSILDIIDILINNNKSVVIYEPSLGKSSFNRCEVISNIQCFAEKSDIILANRYDEILSKYKNKVYTRDLYLRD